MGQEFLVATIIGVVLLIIEYWTGWFAERASLPSLRSILNRFTNKVSGPISRQIRLMKVLLGLMIPLMAAYVNVLFLAPESQIYPGLVGVLTLSLILMTLLATKTIEPPMNSVTAFLIFVSIVAIYVLLIRSSNFLDSTWPAKFSFEPDMTDIKTVAMTIILAVLSVIWATSSIMATHVRGVQEELKERLELLHDAPGISAMLEAGERELFDHVVTEWKEFIKSLEATDRRAADLIQHCVPVKFEGYTLHIGCETLTDVSNIISPVPVSRKTQLPPPKFAIESAMQEFFSKPRIKISCKKIESGEYVEIRKQLDSSERRMKEAGRRIRDKDPAKQITQADA